MKNRNYKNLIVFYAVFKLCRLIKNGAFNKVDTFQRLFSFLCDFIYSSPCKTKAPISIQDAKILTLFLVHVPCSHWLAFSL